MKTRVTEKMFTGNSSSEDSDVSDSFANAKSTFRVSVCLQRYFKDVRARSYVLVSRNRRVRWLQRRIQKVFSLPGACCLCANGHLLPPSEPLGLLSPEDRVEVIPLQDVQIDRTNIQGIIQENKELHFSNEGKIITSTLFSKDCSVAVYNGGNVHENVKNGEEVNDLRNIEFPSKDYVDSITVSSVIADSGLVTEYTVDSAQLNAYETNQTDLNIRDESRTLHDLKRRALALLDTHCSPDVANNVSTVENGAEESQAPRRTRRRVRRRSRRGAASAEPCADSGADVARNEAACTRQPRVVHSLDTSAN